MGGHLSEDSVLLSASPFLVLVLFLAVACSTAGERNGTATPPGSTEECTVLEASPLDSTDIRMRCPLGTADSSLFFGDQQSWDDWMDSCYGEVSAPEIDFGTHDVLGATVTLSCPFAGSPLLLGTQSCRGELRTSVWTWPDHCYCDYFDPFLVLYAVEKGLHSSLSIDLLFESTCEETICACEDGSTVSACDSTQFCPVTDSYTVDVDGLPPEWP